MVCSFGASGTSCFTSNVEYSHVVVSCTFKVSVYCGAFCENLDITSYCTLKEQCLSIMTFLNTTLVFNLR